MKKKAKIITSVLFTVVFTASIAWAGWEKTFVSDYSENGLNVAVSNALAAGIAPKAIVVQGMTIKDMDAEKLTAALCDAGIAVQEMLESLSVLKIDRQTAIAICEDISQTNKFPGSSYSSAAKRTNYDGSGNIIHPPINPRPPQPVQPASGHTFN
jgi:hypothetical protein